MTKPFTPEAILGEVNAPLLGARRGRRMTPVDLKEFLARTSSRPTSSSGRERQACSRSSRGDGEASRIPARCASCFARSTPSRASRRWSASSRSSRSRTAWRRCCARADRAGRAPRRRRDRTCCFKATRAIEHRVRELADGQGPSRRARAPARRARRARRTRSRAASRRVGRTLALEPGLVGEAPAVRASTSWSRGVKEGRRALRVDFRPSPAQAERRASPSPRCASGSAPSPRS